MNEREEMHGDVDAEAVAVEPAETLQAPAIHWGSVRSGLHEIPLEIIRPSENNPRKHFDAQELAGLADSIREDGQLVPILVRSRHHPLLNGPFDGFHFEIIEGERRFRAVKALGWPTIRAVVQDVDGWREALRQSLVANIQRADLTPLEVARAYQDLLDANPDEETVESLAALVGKEVRTVYATLALLDLIPEVQEALGAGRITQTHAELIGREKTPERQRKVFAACFRVEQIWNEGTGQHEPTETLVSEKWLRTWIKEHMREPAEDAPKPKPAPSREERLESAGTDVLAANGLDAHGNVKEEPESEGEEQDGETGGRGDGGKEAEPAAAKSEAQSVSSEAKPEQDTGKAERSRVFDWMKRVIELGGGSTVSDLVLKQAGVALWAALPEDTRSFARELCFASTELEHWDPDGSLDERREIRRALLALAYATAVRDGNLGKVSVLAAEYGVPEHDPAKKAPAPRTPKQRAGRKADAPAATAAAPAETFQETPEQLANSRLAKVSAKRLAERAKLDKISKRAAKVLDEKPAKPAKPAAAAKPKKPKAKAKRK